MASLRLSPGTLSAAVGFAAGASGAFSIATKGRVSLVGVMIAAALIPTAATTGIALAWWNLRIAIGSVLLLGITVFAVNVGALLALLYLGYRPSDAGGVTILPESLNRRGAVVATVVLTLLVTVVVLAGFATQAIYEQNATQAVSNTLSEEEYGSLEAAGITTEYPSPVAVGTEPIVTVAIRRTSDREYNTLPAALERAIRKQTGRDVTVRVRFIDYEQAGTV